MTMRLYNTLTRKKEDFETLEAGVVKMYVCGPTVYNDAHVGHAMSALVFDIVRRYLEFRGFNVRHVMNYTDVDDKIINRANQMGVDPFALSQKYIDDFDQNLADLNILPATAKPRVSKTIPQIIALVQGLVDKACAYPAANGDVYFRVTRDDDYGKLSARKLDDMQAGARIEVEEQKEHPMDFALWKAAKPGEPAWDSPWGKGRPGWHIECSAMNLAELGEQIDIHGGGNDLIFPHHENEIAQTESFTGKPFARYWMHNGMLQLGGEKMSKSLGNIISIKDFLAKRDADVMRMLVLNGSYRAPLMFNEETLDAAEKGLERLKSALRPASASADSSAEAVAALPAASAAVKSAYLAAMDDDFNSAGALGVLFDFVRVLNTARDSGASAAQLTPAQALLRELTGVFGLRLSEKQGQTGAEKFIELLLEVRAEARRQKQWALSDLIRDRLKELGVTVEDGKTSATWRYL
ncbi:MAG: cysteine--tRNA ligase [Anaerolineae bacterium CG_4_9_14_3_um_filter_57_17]|nr:cysteine--tRNA ligase [bacterium]NCT20688.1 cysteine--tRNA ligase [bacterium]OIO86171.1 MAG: cysteine--tRNA ligase [Anaerolineae bacterium CG2_30_57_67]PJB67713.1 MAG: cysteine--tRNA ligase [Anaerolineae bacterium CG_4_9_14_3_um_filter_57_17]